MKKLTYLALTLVLINLITVPTSALTKEIKPIFISHRLNPEEVEFYFLYERTFLRGKIKKTSNQLDLSVVGPRPFKLTVEDTSEGLAYYFDTPSGGASCVIPISQMKNLVKESSGSIRDRLASKDFKSLLISIKPFRLFVNSLIEQSPDLLSFFQYLYGHRSNIADLDPLILEAFDHLSPKNAGALPVNGSLNSADICDLIVDAAERALAACGGDAHCIELILSIVILDYLIPYGCFG